LITDDVATTAVDPNLFGLESYRKTVAANKP
jgi:hypothetical protein